MMPIANKHIKSRIVLTFGKITSSQKFGKYRKDETSKKGKREVKVTKGKKKI